MWFQRVALLDTRAEISITGIVQGVGFRPFCHRLAESLDLKGFVRNMGDAGVQVVVEGDRQSIRDFIKALRSDPPPLSRVDGVKVRLRDPTGDFKRFEVVESEREGLGLPSVVLGISPNEWAICRLVLFRRQCGSVITYLTYMLLSSFQMSTSPTSACSPNSKSIWNGSLRVWARAAAALQTSTQETISASFARFRMTNLLLGVFFFRVTFFNPRNQMQR